MSEESIQEKQEIRPARRPPGGNIHYFPENNDMVFEYVHFNQNKNGTLE